MTTYTLERLTYLSWFLHQIHHLKKKFEITVWLYLAKRCDYLSWIVFIEGFPYGSAGKESSCSVGDLNLIPGLGRSPGEGKGYPLQYSGLENYSPWGCKELDTTERLSLHFTSVFIEEGEKKRLFRRVSGSQQNWVERSESSHTHLPPPPMDNLPPNQHVTPEGYAYHSEWIDITEPEAIVYFRVHCWCCTFCGFDKCMMTYGLPWWLRQ